MTFSSGTITQSVVVSQPLSDVTLSVPASTRGAVLHLSLVTLTR